MSDTASTRVSSPSGPLESLGRFAISVWSGLAEAALLGYLALKSAWLERSRGRGVVARTTLQQIYFTGVQAFLLIAVTALAIGTVVISQALGILGPFVSRDTLQELIVRVLVRELAPIFTVLIVIGRSGTAITTEVGEMKLHQEIDVLSAMGINIDYYIVVPRLAGVTMSVTCLALCFCAIALVGGYAATDGLGLVPITFHLSELLGAVRPADVAAGLIKVLLFGVVVALIHCRHGLAVRRAVTEIPQLTTQAVVRSIILCFVVNVFVSLYVFPS